MSIHNHQPPPRRVLVLYASQTGTAEDLAIQLSATLERHRFTTTTLPCNDLAPLSSLPAHDLVFLLISTTGQGEMPDNAHTFWRGMLRKKIPPGWLAGVRFGVFCLGDSTYPKFCWAGRKVGRRMLQLGAAEVVARGEGDQSGDDGIDGAFATWEAGLRAMLRTEYPLPGGVEEIPDDELLPSKWLLEFADDSPPPPVPNGMDIMRNLHAPRPGAIIASLSRNERLTPADHWQDVRHFSFALPEEASWEPGDTALLSPKNFPADVELFLALQNWTADADRPLRLTPAATGGPAAPCPISEPVSPLTLRTLLTHHLDITAIPRRSFFALAARLTADDTHAERLADFADPQWAEELWDYTTRPRRSLLEVLQEFHSVALGLARLLEAVPRLREREFSVASSPLAAPASVDLLVAVVRYRTVIKKTREGVCTRWLAQLVPGDAVSIVLRKGALALTPAELDRPVVMVGPGTGVAPMRALVQHRVRTGSAADNVLFFGARNKDADFFFRDEWDALEAQGRLRLFTAFSRDQKAKRYVQTAVREQGQAVWDALKPESDGTVFVCGSSGRMPGAVREALIEVFDKYGGLGRKAAVEYLGNIEKRGRYKQETW